MSRLEVFPILGVPEVRPGDDLAGQIAEAAAAGDRTALRDGDVVVVTQKVVSKAEGKLERIDPDDPLLGLWPGAMFVVRVRTREVFPNCPRYIHRMQLVERSRYVPAPGEEPPVPEWKTRDWARDVLPSPGRSRR